MSQMMYVVQPNPINCYYPILFVNQPNIFICDPSFIQMTIRMSYSSVYFTTEISKRLKLIKLSGIQKKYVTIQNMMQADFSSHQLFHVPNYLNSTLIKNTIIFSICNADNLDCTRSIIRITKCQTNYVILFFLKYATRTCNNNNLQYFSENWILHTNALLRLKELHYILFQIN